MTDYFIQYKPGSSSSPSGSAGGDLGGTYPNPTVVSLTGSSGTVTFANTLTPVIKQSDLTTNSGTGASLTIQAQNETGTTSTGGSLILASGSGTSTPGDILFKRDTVQVASVSSPHGHLVAGLSATDAQTHIGPLVGSETSLAAIYLLGNGVARTSGNYNFAAAGGNLYCQAASSFTFSIGGTQYAGLGTTDFTLSNGVGLTWSPTSASPTLYQSDDATNSATGKTLSIHAQNETGTTSTGGALNLSGGTGTSAYGTIQHNSPIGGGYLAYTFASDANQTLTAAQSANNILVINSGVTSTGRTITLSRPAADKSLIFVKNNNAQTITIAFATGTGVTVATATSALITTDGTNAIKIMAGT